MKIIRILFKIKLIYLFFRIYDRNNKDFMKKFIIFVFI
jgi:hypothetical protein